MDDPESSGVGERADLTGLARNSVNVTESIHIMFTSLVPNSPYADATRRQRAFQGYATPAVPLTKGYDSP